MNLHDIYDGNGYVNFPKAYVYLFDKPSFTVSIRNIDIHKSFKEIYELVADFLPLTNRYTTYVGQDGKRTKVNDTYYYSKSYEMLVSYDSEGTTDFLYFYIPEPAAKSKIFAQMLEICNKYPSDDVPSSDINIIAKNPTGSLYLKKVDIKDIKLDIPKNYNDDFIEIDKVIKGRLSTPNDKGIVLLHGMPGTGKTTYIRHLINTINKRIIFVPTHVAVGITDPSFLTFLMDFPDSILVIEDAEKIISDRATTNNNSVSDLLNISDGLLSDVLSIQLLCTFNADISSIDKALLRKGRIIAKYEFKELDVHKCNVINLELGHSHEIQAPMTLSDLYNQEDISFGISKKKVIGF